MITIRIKVEENGRLIGDKGHAGDRLVVHVVKLEIGDQCADSFIGIALGDVLFRGLGECEARAKQKGECEEKLFHSILMQISCGRRKANTVPENKDSHKAVFKFIRRGKRMQHRQGCEKMEN